VCELGERNSAGDHVLDAQTGTELGAARRELDDAVTAGVREALDGCVDGFGADTVDGGEGKGMLLGPTKHLGIDLGSCDRHGGSPPYTCRSERSAM